MTSQDHREAALSFVELADKSAVTVDEQTNLARAQIHATMAVYEGMYELLGDDSQVDIVMRRIRQNI